MNELPLQADSAVDRDLSLLEQKLATLIAHTRALRAANEALRKDLTAAHETNRALGARVTAATERLDALLASIPAGAE
jgi:hypothetical protein